MTSRHTFILFILLTASFVFSLSDARYSPSASDAHAPHASWYGYAPFYEHDAPWGSPSAWHTHGHGACKFAPSRPVTGRSAEDGSAESCHGVTAGGEGQAAGEMAAQLQLHRSAFPHVSFSIIFTTLNNNDMIILRLRLESGKHEKD